MTTNIAGTFIYICVSYGALRVSACRGTAEEWQNKHTKKKRSKQQPNCGDASTRTSDPRAILKLVDDEDDEYKIMAIEGRLFCKSQPCCAHSRRHTETVNTQVVGTRHTTFSHSTLMFLYFFWFFCFFFLLFSCCCWCIFYVLKTVWPFDIVWFQCSASPVFSPIAFRQPFSHTTHKLHDLSIFVTLAFLLIRFFFLLIVPFTERKIIIIFDEYIIMWMSITYSRRVVQLYIYMCRFGALLREAPLGEPFIVHEYY